jgi:hypothetical protein
MTGCGENGNPDVGGEHLGPPTFDPNAAGSDKGTVCRCLNPVKPPTSAIWLQPIDYMGEIMVLIAQTHQLFTV